MKELLNYFMTRDSPVWNWAMAGALITYLISKQIPPTAWTYMDWLQFAAATIAALSGKLSNSKLKSRKEQKEEEESNVA